MATDAPLVATYSIVACDLDAGQWGVATQSKFLAVGSRRAVGGAGRRRGRHAVLREPALRARRPRAPPRRALRRGGGRAADGGRRRARAAPARGRRRARERRDVHRLRVHGLGGRLDRAVLRGAGEHPRRRGDGRGARDHVHGHGRTAARRAAARVPRRGPGGRRRPARAAVGGAPRRRARRRLRRPERHRSSICASTTTRTPIAELAPPVRASTRSSSARRRGRLARRRRRAARRGHGAARAARLRRRARPTRSRAWAGTENLEERVDGADRIDPVVLAELRAR